MRLMAARCVGLVFPLLSLFADAVALAHVLRVLGVLLLLPPPPRPAMAMPIRSPMIRRFRTTPGEWFLAKGAQTLSRVCGGL